MSPAQSNVPRGPAKAAAVIVAHPDDEVLWCGGFVLSHPTWHWHIVTLCRAGDPDRAPRFRRVLAHLNAVGTMADLDDGPEQAPVAPPIVQNTILGLLPAQRFDLVLTHGPQGEYTRHRRHEDCSRAVASLWSAGRLQTSALWLFAYNDAGGAGAPRARKDAHRRFVLAESIWLEKRRLITDFYGFAIGSWEGRIVPREEAFWCFHQPAAAAAWITDKEAEP